MAIVRDARRDSLGGDRAISDRLRHREKVREALKEGLPDAIADESIIGSDGKKIIKVPIRSIKEYRFVYGDNQPKAGEGSGDEEPGQVIPGSGGQPQPGPGPGAGSEPGEEVYEIEMTLDEAITLLFEDLELPHMERKKLRQIMIEEPSKSRGYRKRGSRLSRKATVKKKQKRVAAVRGLRPSTLTSVEYDALPFEEQRFYLLRDDGQFHFRIPLSKDDLRFVRRDIEAHPQSNAAVFCIMDVSGSMGIRKKFLARTFFLLLYNFVRTKYKHVEVVFIAHHAEAKVVSEDEFFHRGESGGTMISSGYQKMLDEIDARFPPEAWNIYGFHCSDGDNFRDDNERTFELARKICTHANLFGYGEVKPENDYENTWGMFGISYSPSSLLEQLRDEVSAENFAAVEIKSKEDVWPAFKGLLTHENKEQSS